MFAALVYAAFIAVMVEGNRSEQAMLVMLGVSICAPILVARGRPLLMAAAAIGIVVYTGFAAVATNVATGREEDPFGNCTLAHWDSLIHGEECEGAAAHDRGPWPLPPECFEAIADAETWEELRGELLAYRDRGDVESVRTLESGEIGDRGFDRGTGRDVLRIVQLLDRRDRPLAAVDVWRTDTGTLAAGMWVLWQCGD